MLKRAQHDTTKGYWTKMVFTVCLKHAAAFLKLGLCRRRSGIAGILKRTRCGSNYDYFVAS
jgi:hypothetical protein